MSFQKDNLGRSRPESIREQVKLPRRKIYTPSPVDWRDEILYFLLIDRFSDGKESSRLLVDRSRLFQERPGSADQPWRWDLWAESGASRFQGGTLPGITSKLGYLKKMGITTLWMSPVFKQRRHLDSYHGYGVQDFLEVEPRFGTRRDLVRLVTKAHQLGMRIILDIIFNHSGPNWLYPKDTPGGQDIPKYTPGQYPFGSWVNKEGQPTDEIVDKDDGVWPIELQNVQDYTRSGFGNLGAGDINDPDAEHKRSDFFNLRDFYLDGTTLNDLARCYKYWIALTDCDGFRIDTLKHVTLEEARNFCGTIKEFAANLGKKNFFLVGEIAGGDYAESRYLDVLAMNLNAALDIGEMRPLITDVARGIAHPAAFFTGFDPGQAVMGSHRNLGNRHVSILDDHDHVFGAKLRFSAGAVNDHQVVAGVALQLFTLGIPCVYYGTEQGLAGPEPSEHAWIPDWGTSDRYLREAMFGPLHPRKHGSAGYSNRVESFDTDLPGFGPFGTAGRHVFDETNPIYLRIANLAGLRGQNPVLRDGRQYLRPFSNFGRPFQVYGPGEIIPWSRILDDEEAVCIINSNGLETRGGDVIVDPSLNPPGSSMVVIGNTTEAANPQNYQGAHPIGSLLPVLRSSNGTAYIEIRDLPASEVLILINHPEG
jgi:glycosidase